MRLFSILIATIFLPFIGTAQRITYPSWSESSIYFETAKIQKYNEALKKFGAESFKTATISITNADQYSPTFTIDIPDIFFIKEGVVIEINYKQRENGTETIEYSIHKDNTLVTVVFLFTIGSENPNFILVTINNNIYSKTDKNTVYKLSELK